MPLVDVQMAAGCTLPATDFMASGEELADRRRRSAGMSGGSDGAPER
jgi:hypothetical protein